MSLLRPGAHRGTIDDDALVRAMVEVEQAWLRALGSQHKIDDIPTLDPVAVENAGNPVLPLVKHLRKTSAEVHIGLTSQDVLDTALVLLARHAIASVRTDLGRVADALAELADQHRATVMAGRTLTQFAVPITFGLTAAQWLEAVLDADDALAGLVFPVQCGGAAGTLSRAGEVAEPLVLSQTLAAELDLTWTLPWHTRRTPITRIGDALTETADALGVIANNVITLGRPEIAEIREGAAEGRGRSSTMPQKQNPVLAVLIASAASRAPLLAAQLHHVAGQQVDQRAPGAWHAEWPAFKDLLELTIVAASQAAELVATLEIDTAKMAARAETDELRAEQTGSGPYLGASDAFVTAVLTRRKSC